MQHLFFCPPTKRVSCTCTFSFFTDLPLSTGGARSCACLMDHPASQVQAGPEVDREVQVSETRRMGRSYDRVEWWEPQTYVAPNNSSRMDGLGEGENSNRSKHRKEYDWSSLSPGSCLGSHSTGLKLITTLLSHSVRKWLRSGWNPSQHAKRGQELLSGAWIRARSIW